MSVLDDKKDELREEISRRERELRKLESLPDLDALPEGTVAGMAVRLGRTIYTYVGFKTRNRWYVTGKTGPNGVTSDALAEWLTRSGRNLESFLVLAEIETRAEPTMTVTVETIDLGELLGGALEQAQRAGIGPVPNGQRHWLLDGYGD